MKKPPKKIVYIDLQIISFKKAKAKKHLKPEDTVELFTKHKLN